MFNTLFEKAFVYNFLEDINIIEILQNNEKQVEKILNTFNCIENL